MKTNLGKLTIISLILNVLLSLFFVAKRYYYSHSSSPSQTSTLIDSWNDSRNSELQTLPIDSTDIVFVGNSITEGFPVNEVFHSIHVKNRGIGFNQSKHVLGRIDGIMAGKPKKLFLEIGVNDLLQSVPVDTLYRNYRQIIRKIQTGSPDTKLFVQSIFPVGKTYENLNPLIIAFNGRLKKYCDSLAIPFLDIHSRLASHGRLDPPNTMDDLHLTGVGYQIWKNAIDSLVN